MTIYTTRDTATQASLGRLRELVLVWVLVGARALLHLLLASPLLVAVSPFTAARCCRASCFLLVRCVSPPPPGASMKNAPLLLLVCARGVLHRAPGGAVPGPPPHLRPSSPSVHLLRLRLRADASRARPRCRRGGGCMELPYKRQGGLASTISTCYTPTYHL